MKTNTKASLSVVFCISALLLTSLACSFGSQAVSVSPTPAPTPTPTVTPAVALTPDQVLRSNGFELYPADEENCHQKCQTYRNDGKDLLAYLYQDGTLTLGVRFTPGSGVDGGDQAAIVVSILKSLYPPEVVSWVAKNSVNLEINQPVSAIVSGYYLRATYVKVNGGTGIIIIITPTTDSATDLNG